MTISVQPVRGTELSSRGGKSKGCHKGDPEELRKQWLFKIETPMIEDIERLDKSDGGEESEYDFQDIKGTEAGSRQRPNGEDLGQRARFDLTLPLSVLRQ